jgi:BASS family bile acid:Na+ symporter
MESLVSFSKWLSKWFTVAVILWAAFNYALPATSSWVIPNTAYLLGLILFGMGLTLTTEDFKRIAKRPIPVVLGTVAHYVIMPGLAWLLCMIFHLKGATAAGVILVGSCPSGTSSSVMAFLSGGDVALDVSIETLSTLLAPLMIPTLLSFLAGHYVSVPAQNLFLSTLRIVVVPIILGVVIHSIFGKKINAIIKIMPLISQAAILLIVGAVVSATMPIFSQQRQLLSFQLSCSTIFVVMPLVLDFQNSLVWKNLNKKPLPSKWGCKTQVLEQPLP